MADQSRTFRIEFVGDSTSATKSMQQMETQGGKLSSAMGNLGNEIKSRFVVTSGDMVSAAGAAANALADMVGSAMEDAQSQSMLATQLRAVTTATGEQIAGVEDYISTMQEATGVMDDELRPAFGQLARATGDIAQSQGLMQLAMDISAATGRDLGTVATALGKAYQGQMTGLSRLGIVMKDSEGNALSWNEAQKKLNETFGGAAAAAAETTAGKMRILNARFAEAKEQIGYQLLPALNMLAGALLGTMDAISGLNSATGGWLGKIGSSFLNPLNLISLGASKAKKETVDLSKAMTGSTDEMVRQFVVLKKGSLEGYAKFQDLARMSETTAESVLQGMRAAGVDTEMYSDILGKVRAQSYQTGVATAYMADELEDEADTAAKSTKVEKERASALTSLRAIYGDLLFGMAGFTGMSSDYVISMAKDLEDLSSSVMKSVPGISDAFAAAGDAARGSKEEVNIATADMKKALDQQVEDSNQWAADIKKAIALGIDVGIVQKWAEAGPKSRKEMEATISVAEEFGVDSVNLVKRAAEADAKAVVDALFMMKYQAALVNGQINSWLSTLASRMAPSGDVGSELNRYLHETYGINTGGYGYETHALGGRFQGATIVGEFGPEIVVGAGTVIPNDKAFGGAPTTIIMELDGRIIGQVVVDLSKRTGGLPIRIKAGS